jgi:hypothetical protein
VCSLNYSTTYQYTCGSPVGGFSSWFTFTTPPKPEANAHVVIGVIGDPAWTAGTVVNVQVRPPFCTPSFRYRHLQTKHQGNQKGTTWGHWDFLSLQDIIADRTIQSLVMLGDLSYADSHGQEAFDYF